jgi:hypothetical protein
MVRLLAGMLAALAAATLYGLAIVVQAGEARVVAERRGYAALAFDVAMRRRWQAGAALGVLGWPLQAAALLLAPLVLVQPALAVGLAVLLVAANRRLHERSGARERASVLAIAGGLALLVATVPPRVPLATPALVPALAALAVLACGPLVVRRGLVGRGRLTALAAGAAYGAAGLATKALADGAERHALAPAAAWLALVAAVSAVGAIDEMLAYRAAAVTRTAPLVFVLEVLVPTAFALLAGHEVPADGAGRALLAAGLVAVGAGTAALASSTPVTTLLDEAARARGSSGAVRG